MHIRYTVKYDTDKKISDINKEWGDKFAQTFNQMNAAIVFAVALTKEGKVRMCVTTDISPQDLKKVLEGVVENLNKIIKP